MNIVTPPKLLCYSENNFIYFVNDSVPQDFGVGAYPTLSVSAAIDADGETIVFFSSETKQEITRRKFDNIADKNGVDYGVDAATAFQAINTALGVVSTSGGGGGGGDATAANQTTQITEAQTTNAKLDAINATIAGQKTGISQQVFTDANGDVVLMRTILDADGTPTLSWIDTTGAVVTPAQPVIPTDSALRTLNELVHKAINSGVDYNADDVIIETQVLDLSVTPIAIISSLWYNSTQNIQIAAPLPADIRQVTETGLAKESTAQAILAQADDIRVNTQASNSNLEQILNAQFQPTTTGTATVSVAGVLADIGVIDCTELKYIELAIKGTFTGANLIIQGCAENSFLSLPISIISPSLANGTGAPVTAITTTDTNWVIPTTSKFLRFNLTAITSGSLTAEIRFYKKSSPIQRVEQFAELVTNQTNGLQISKYFIEAVDLGLIPNYSTVKKSGKNFDLDTATVPESVWNGGGLYTGFPTGAIEELQVVSSSASDIGTLTITYLPTSASTEYVTDTVAVNGTTPVNTGITAYRVHAAFYVSNANTSTQFNVGVITVRYRTTTTTIFLAMPAGRNQTYMSGYTIPAGKRGLLLPTTYRASAVAGAFLECAMYIRPLNGAPRLRRNVTATVGTDFRDNYEGGILLTAGTDIMPTVITSSANNVTVEASYTILIFPA